MNPMVACRFCKKYQCTCEDDYGIEEFNEYVLEMLIENERKKKMDAERVNEG